MMGQQRWGGGRRRRSSPRAKKGTNMELLVVAIVAIVGLGLFRYMRTRTAH
jgi:hypothetical protein